MIGKLLKELADPMIKLGGYGIGFSDKPIFDAYHEKKPAPKKMHLKGDYRSEDETLEAMKNYLGEKGLNIRDVPTEIGVDGKHSAARYNNDVLLAKTYKGKKLNTLEQAVRLAHEYKAGFDHENSDEKAQRDAVEFLEKEFPFPAARELAMRDLRRMGYSLN
jgi:hypothetical protein